MSVDPSWEPAHRISRPRNWYRPASAALARAVIRSVLIAAMLALLRHFSPHGI